MAETLLHVAIAQNFIAKASMNDTHLVCILENPVEFYLGSIIFDLPYYDGFIKNCIKTIKKQKIYINPFGLALHNDNSVNICQSLWQSATTDKETALAAGALSHYAVDVIFHKKIEKHLIPLTKKTHEELEKNISLHCYYDLLKHSGLGNSYCASTLLLTPYELWSTYYANALSQVVASVPTPPVFEKWLRNLHYFGLLNSLSKAPWIQTFPEDNPTLEKTSLELLDEAQMATEVLINAVLKCDQKADALEQIEIFLDGKRMADGQVPHNIKR